MEHLRRNKSSATNKILRRKYPTKAYNLPKISIHDLDIQLRVVSPKLCKQEQGELIHMLGCTGFNVIALSHTVYGNVSPEDNANIVIPLPIQAFSKRRNLCGKGDNEVGVDSIIGNNAKLTILRRLNVVIEQVSDLSYFNTNSNEIDSNVLGSYDLVAFSPRNDAVFTSICNTSTLSFDILTIDYTAGRGGVQLPYKLKTSNLATAAIQGVTFELLYAPSVLNLAKRKAFVSTGRQLLSACIGISPSPRIILSSGNRLNTRGKDLGIMALRGPRDLINLCKILLGFDDDMASEVLEKNCVDTVIRGYARRTGHDKLKHSMHSVMVYNSLDIGNNGMFKNFGVQCLQRGQARLSAPLLGRMDRVLHSNYNVDNRVTLRKDVVLPNSILGPLSRYDKGEHKELDDKTGREVEEVGDGFMCC